LYICSKVFLSLQDNYYEKFNKALAGSIPMTNEYYAMRELMNSAHIKLPKYRGIAYRGAGKTESSFAKTLIEGQKFDFNGRFTSSSLEAFIADNFRYGGQGDVIWEIESKTGVDLAKINSSESEILFKPYTNYQLIKIEKSNKNNDVFIYKIKEL
jgi:hypothetical protein